MRGRALALVALGLGLGSCDKKVDYSYFNVNVTVDRTTFTDELLDLVSACGASATLDDGRVDLGDLRCVRHKVADGNSLGTFQYSTSRTTGSVKFKVTLTSYWGADLGTGESSTVGIASNSTTTVDLVVKALPDAPTGPPTAGGPDAAGTAGPPPDAAAPELDAGVDGPAGDGGVDAAVDAAPDASPDLAVDVAPDSAPDLAPDSAPDAAADASGAG
jgi:hypothetical protein